jgi:DNA-binding transcriptional LysR family regulator
LSQLEAVVAVAEERSFSKAAASQMVAQSSLSRTVAQVERLCGVRLFERTTRALKLTTDGDQFIRTARNILQTYRREIDDFESYLAGTKGVLRLAALPSLAVSLLPPMVTRFRARYPDIMVEVEDVLADPITDYVRNSAVDLAVTAEPPRSLRAAMLSAGIRFDAIAEDHFYCVLPNGHSLLGNPTIEWSDLSGEPFIAFDESSSVRRIVDDALTSRGVVPARLVSARNVASIAGLCAAGLGLSAAPGFVLALMSVPGVAIRPFAGEPVTRRIGVLRDIGRRPTPPTRQFLEIIGEAVADIQLPVGAYWLDHADHP